MMNGSKAYGQSMTDGDVADESAEGLGSGVQQDGDNEGTEDGYLCLGKMPVTGGFFTRESEHGQP